MQKDQAFEYLFAVDYGKILKPTASNAYRVDPGSLPDEMWLVELSRAGHLPEWQQGELGDLPDGTKIRVIPSNSETHTYRYLVKMGTEWVHEDMPDINQ